MQHILTTVRTTLSRKQYSTQMIARIALNELAKFLNKSQLEWYIRTPTLFVELTNQSDIILLFQQKSNILDHINTTLLKYGYDKWLRDIRPKKMRSQPSNDGYH